jgi:hypothetical protein
VRRPRERPAPTIRGPPARRRPDAWAGVRKREAAARILGALKDVPVFKDVVVTTPEEIARRGDLAGTTLRLALREGPVLYERARD